MEIEAIIDRVSVTIDVPDCCEGKLSMDDAREMVCHALGHNELHQVVQLIVGGVAQWDGEYSSGKEMPVDADVWIDVDWDSIDTPMQDLS